jgi:hypothetical protein
MLLFAAWGGAILLTLYGGPYTLGGVLAVVGLIPASPTADWTALRWHAFLWDPWFLLLGVLLGVAARGYRRGLRSKVTRISGRTR